MSQRQGAPELNLPDRDIRAAITAGRIVIDPSVTEAVQPSSVDLHLDRRFRGIP